MLVLDNLRPLRLHHGLTRAHITSLTALDTARLREIELGEVEPWYDEALMLSRAFCLPGIFPLFASGDLTLSEAGGDTDADLPAWRSGARVPLSLALRLTRRWGLTDPAQLATTDLTTQIWDIIAATDRHPEAAGYCPWCAADIALGQTHLPTCLPSNLWTARNQPHEGTLLLPARKGGRVSGIPARGLRSLRDERGQTQREVAAVIGVNANYYSRLERADAPLMTEHANTLAAHFNVDPARIYAGEVVENTPDTQSVTP